MKSIDILFPIEECENKDAPEIKESDSSALIEKFGSTLKEVTELQKESNKDLVNEFKDFIKSNEEKKVETPIEETTDEQKIDKEENNNV